MYDYDDSLTIWVGDLDAWINVDFGDELEAEHDAWALEKELDWTDHFGHVIVVSTKTIHPPDHQFVTLPQLVEQTTTLGPFNQSLPDTGNSVVRDHLIDVKPSLTSLADLVVQGLVHGGNTSVENRSDGAPPFVI